MKDYNTLIEIATERMKSIKNDVLSVQDKSSKTWRKTSSNC